MSAITTDIKNCARCQQDHAQLFFAELTNPIVLPSGAPITHWATCPTNSEPIVMRIEKPADHELPKDYWETAQ